MKRRLAIAIAIGLLAVSSPVRANILNLDASSAGDFSFQGIPPNRIATTIANPLLGSGNLMGDPNLGAYILAPPAPNTFVSGPASVTGDFSLPNVKEALVYTAGDGVLVGIVNWTELQGSTPIAEFIGTFTGVGSGVFPASVSGLHIDLATTFLPTTSLVDLAATGGKVTGGIGSGAVELHAVPAPVEGAGWTGVIAAACVGLFMLARRRRFIAA